MHWKLTVAHREPAVYQLLHVVLLRLLKVGQVSPGPARRLQMRHEHQVTFLQSQSSGCVLGRGVPGSHHSARLRGGAAGQRGIQLLVDHLHALRLRLRLLRDVELKRHAVTCASVLQLELVHKDVAAEALQDVVAGDKPEAGAVVEGLDDTKVACGSNLSARCYVNHSIFRRRQCGNPLCVDALARSRSSLRPLLPCPAPGARQFPSLGLPLVVDRHLECHPVPGVEAPDQHLVHKHILVKPPLGLLTGDKTEALIRVVGLDHPYKLLIQLPLLQGLHVHSLRAVSSHLDAELHAISNGAITDLSTVNKNVRPIPIERLRASHESEALLHPKGLKDPCEPLIGRHPLVVVVVVVAVVAMAATVGGAGLDLDIHSGKPALLHLHVEAHNITHRRALFRLRTVQKYVLRKPLGSDETKSFIGVERFHQSLVPATWLRLAQHLDMCCLRLVFARDHQVELHHGSDLDLPNPTLVQEDITLKLVPSLRA
mmetsp:Transcript_27370/g.62391  ORF Transcript_27370/g.62391 Transcript_27370/m.62391 type:complete len:485 (-) Transcript_27370:199-1653(-)